MKEFLKENGVLAVELEELQQRAAEELGWTYSYWQNRYVGRTPMDATDRKALGAILSEMRHGAKVVYLLPEEQ